MRAGRTASAILTAEGKGVCPPPHFGVLVTLGVEESMSTFDGDRKPEPKMPIGFVGRSVLPGESQEEFDRLEDEVYEQYEPLGPVEEDLVETIVSAIWRKRHTDTFHRAFKARMIWGSCFSYPGDPDGASRITQAYVERISPMMAKEIAKFATAMVKRKLDEDADPSGKFGGDADKVAVSIAAPAPQEDFDRKIFVGSEDISKTVLEAITDKAFVEKKCTGQGRVMDRPRRVSIRS
jgi:hypothetical protein